jgi:hypothetical protein
MSLTTLLLGAMVGAALAADGEPTGAIELSGAYSPGRSLGFGAALRAGVPIELTRQAPMWQAYPEFSVRFVNFGAGDSLGRLGNVSAAAGGRLSAVVWKASPRKKKRFKGREKYRELVEFGISAHGGVGFDTQQTDPSLDPDGLFDPRPYGDLGVYGAYVDPNFTIGGQFTQSILLPAGWELERTPITTVGIYVELPIEKLVQLF